MDLKTRDPKVEAVIAREHEDLYHIIERDWSPTNLMSSCSLVLATDGIESDPVEVPSVLHAQLVVNFEMAHDWGWGFGEIISSVRGGENRIEQTGLTWISEVFKILDTEFGCTCPNLDGYAITDSTVFKAFRDFFFRGLGYDLKLDEPHPSIEEWEQSVYRDDVDAIIRALIRQLENGHNELLDPAPQTQDGKPTDVEYSATAQGMNLIVEVVFDGQRRQITAELPSVHRAQAAEENHDLKMALIWVMTKRMDSEEGLRIIEGLPVAFSSGTQIIQEDCDLSTDDLAKLIFSTNVVDLVD